MKIPLDHSQARQIPIKMIHTMTDHKMDREAKSLQVKFSLVAIYCSNAALTAVVKCSL